MMIVQSPAQANPTRIMCSIVLAVVRLNSERRLAGEVGGNISVFFGDTRPRKGVGTIWQVFWLAVAGIDALAFPGKSPVAL